MTNVSEVLEFVFFVVALIALAVIGGLHLIFKGVRGLFR